MQLTLTNAESKFVRRKVESGAYPIEHAVIKESLRVLQADEARERTRLEPLIQQGLDDVAAD